MPATPLVMKDQDVPAVAPSTQVNRQRTRRNFRKTELCRFWGLGRCSKGQGCDWAHGEVELRNRPDLTKTSICRRWVRKACELTSEQCPFAHGNWELTAHTGGLKKAQARLTPAALQVSTALPQVEEAVNTDVKDTLSAVPGKKLRQLKAKAAQQAKFAVAARAAGMPISEQEEISICTGGLKKPQAPLTMPALQGSTPPRQADLKRVAESLGCSGLPEETFAKMIHILDNAGKAKEGIVNSQDVQVPKRSSASMPDAGIDKPEVLPQPQTVGLIAVMRSPVPSTLGTAASAQFTEVVLFDPGLLQSLLVKSMPDHYED